MTTMTKTEALQATARMILDGISYIGGARPWCVERLRAIVAGPEGWEDTAVAEWVLGDKVGCDLRVEIASKGHEVKIGWSGTSRTVAEAAASADLYRSVAALAHGIDTFLAGRVA